MVGTTTKPFGSLVAEDSMGQKEVVPAKGNVNTTAVEKDPDSAVHMVQR
jgi:hypothetical protein